jgi:8-oxo-dGTP diphosphatase
MAREFPDRPVVAVGAIVFDRDGQVILVRRGQAPMAGAWSLPGGAVEIGESLTDAVAREVEEETGLSVEVGERVEVVEHVSRDADGRVVFHYVIVDFVCLVSGGTLRAGTDAAEVARVDPSALEPFGLSAKAQAVIARALGIVAAGRGRTLVDAPPDR